MIEATCAACGNIVRVAETELPAGAKFVSCARCKARVVLPARAGTGNDLFDLADLPAPRRPSPLGSEPSRPAPRSGLAAGEPDRPAGAEPDLPAPRTGARPAVPPPKLDVIDLPAPKIARPTTDPVLRASQQADLLAPRPKAALGDLPAPKPKPSTLPKLPPLAPPSAPAAARSLPDLPAPKPAATARPSVPAIPVPRVPTSPAPPPIADLPAPKLGGLGDLPAPRPSRTAPVAPRAALDEIDLPAPRALAEIDLPAPRALDEIDLPAPRALDEIDLGDLPAPAVGDLPVPKLGGLGDLPAPKLGGLGDLPAPKLGGLGDLPAPKLGGLGDLPAPKLGGLGDLPAPKLGALDDLPAPRPGTGGELPAPKGFFDDLPGMPDPGKPALPAPKGFFDDLPQPSAGPKPELPAPKGFFDDLPQPSGPAPAARPDLPAPKGFFDDLPGMPDPGKPAPPAPKGFFDDLPAAAKPGAEVAPKGFFDDLPAAAKPGAEVAPKGFFDDLPQPSRARVESVELPIELPDLGELPGPAAGTASLDLDLEVPELDLGPSTAPPASSIAPRASQFDDLDLSPPSAAPVRFDPPRAQPAASAHSEAPKPASGSIALTAAGDGELALELEEPRPSATTSQRLAPKRIVEKVVDEAEVARRRRRRIRIAALATVGTLGLGAGGFYFYQRHAAQQEHRDEVERHLSAARSAYAATDPTHWQRASRAAKKVLELEPAQPDALGIAAESLFADAIANGTGATTQMAQGRKLLATALESNVSTPAIARAQALSALSANQADRAIAKLQPLAAAAPKDGTLALYLGWAQAARGDAPAAIQAFTDAAASAPIKVHALYGRARVKLAQNDLAGAREDFAAVLELARDHIGAQVGLAAAQPASQAQQQEADLLAILQRKDLDAGDPRAVVQAWSLAAEAARRGGRLDAARERYRKALALIANDVAALTGLAEVELRDGKLDAAGEAISKALNQSADDLHAQLVAAEVSIQHKRFDDAEARIGALARRAPPPPAVDQARLQMVTGKLLEARGRDDAAVDAYVEAAKLVGDTDLAPALAAVAKLGQLADAATAANDPARAAELRSRADQLIAGFADGAQQDPQLALTLGVAYLGTGDATKAEPWLRRAAEGRPNEADPAYQLAKALARLRRTDEAIAALRKARALAPDRAEIGLELARTYEAAGRDPEAAELYDKLIAAPDAGVELRGRAGRFFARTGQLDKAAAQGEQLAAAAPTHPAGWYLKGEAALAANRPDEAAKLFRQAVDADRDPQYLDAQGRAAEAQLRATGDTKFQDVALRAYLAAAELAPNLANPLIGQGRLYVARREAAKAIPPLLAASKLRPESAEVAQLIGLSYKELQERKVAIEWLARAYRLAPDAETAWSLGQLYTEANQPALAIDALANATRLALEAEKRGAQETPWLTEALYQLGRVSYDAHQEAGAKAAWEKFVARNPKPGAKLDEVRRELATTLQRY